jgi:hypothetical protein
MKVRFVCNLPGADKEGLRKILETGLGGIWPDSKEMVEVDPSWERIGFNLIGPVRGPKPFPGDVGIYEILKEGVHDGQVG